MACPWCPAIADGAHTPACDINKADAVRFKRRKMQKKLAADAAAAGDPPAVGGRMRTALKTLAPDQLG